MYKIANKVTFIVVEAIKAIIKNSIKLLTFIASSFSIQQLFIQFEMYYFKDLMIKLYLIYQYRLFLVLTVCQ